MNSYTSLTARSEQSLTTSIPSTNLENILNCSTNGHAADGQMSQTLSSDLVIFKCENKPWVYANQGQQAWLDYRQWNQALKVNPLFLYNEMFLALEENIGNRLAMAFRSSALMSWLSNARGTRVSSRYQVWHCIDSRTPSTTLSVSGWFCSMYFLYIFICQMALISLWGVSSSKSHSQKPNWIKDGHKFCHTSYVF